MLPRFRGIYDLMYKKEINNQIIYAMKIWFIISFLLFAYTCKYIYSSLQLQDIIFAHLNALIAEKYICEYKVLDISNDTCIGDISYTNHKTNQLFVQKSNVSCNLPFTFRNFNGEFKSIQTPYNHIILKDSVAVNENKCRDIYCNDHNNLHCVNLTLSNSIDFTSEKSFDILKVKYENLFIIKDKNDTVIIIDLIIIIFSYLWLLLMILIISITGPIAIVALPFLPFMMYDVYIGDYHKRIKAQQDNIRELNAKTKKFDKINIDLEAQQHQIL